MTTSELIKYLNVLPPDCKVMSNSGWECCETNIGGIWYSESTNEVHLTQGGECEKEEGYNRHALRENKSDFKMIYCEE